MDKGEYAIIDLEKYNQLIADQKILDELTQLIEKSTRYSRERKDLIIDDDEKILEYLKFNYPIYNDFLREKKEEYGDY